MIFFLEHEKNIYLLFFESCLDEMNSKLENVKLPLPNSTRKELLTFLRSKFSNFIFRRVGKVLCKQEDMIGIEKYQPRVGDSGIYIESEFIHPSEYNPDFFTSEQMEKNLEFKSKKFSFFTSTFKLRDNDKWGKSSIYCASMDYNQLDFLSNDCTFEPLNLKELRSNTILPRVGDLICMEVEIGSKGKPQAKWWFNCSEQFFHAWTLIMYDSHESFGVKEDLYVRSFSGNRLQTNTFLKYSLSRKDNNISLDENECHKRYYRLRTEYVSKKWVHLYCSLVMLARFGELPTVHNIPNNINEPEITKWDLPPYFVQTLLSKHTHFFENISESFHPEKYFDLEGTIFERKIIEVPKIEVVIDRPSLEGVDEKPILAIPEKIDVCDEEEFPSLLDSIKVLCKEKASANIIQTPMPKVVAKEERTSFIWGANLNIGAWSSSEGDDLEILSDISLEENFPPLPKKEEEHVKPEVIISVKEEETPAEEKNPTEQQPEWFCKFEKIKILMEEENKQKFEKIKEEMQKKLEEDLEKIRIQLRKEMEVTLEKIQIAMQ